MTYRQPAGELETHLSEQLDFLLRSAAAYDSGATHEGKRLATQLRLLLHSSRTSTPLLGQLGLLEEISFLDTSGRIDGIAVGCSRLVILTKGAYRPKFDFPIPRQQVRSFASWWHQVVIADTSMNIALSRRDLVLAVCHQDGGAHVDPELRDHYARVSRGTFGWTELIDGACVPVPALELACVRQIAHEAIRSLECCSRIGFLGRRYNVSSPLDDSSD